MKRIIAGLLVLFSIFTTVWAVGEKPKTEVVKEITMWESLNSLMAESASNMAELPIYKELEKRTGINVKFMHPPIGQEKEHFSLLVASNELPDMIRWQWITYYPGGPEKAMQGGVIIELNDLIEKYAPNLSRCYEKHPEWEKASKTDSGRLYRFPVIQVEGLSTYFGPILRRDWLDELGLSVPETIDEWYTTLKALQQKTEHPLSFTGFGKGGRDIKGSSAFVSAYGIGMGWYHVDGKVKWGQYEPGIKEFLHTFRKWYVEGLLDPEFITNDKKTFDAKILNNRAAAFVGMVGSNMGGFLDAMEKKDPKFDLVAAKYPVLKKGDVAFFGFKVVGYKNGRGLAITSQAKDPVLCTKWGDYGYGEEGHILYNFGIEGESFNWIEGFPTFTELITNNPDGLGTAAALFRYTRVPFIGPNMSDMRALKQYALKRPQQSEAVEIWGQTNAADHVLPPITSSPEESDEIAALMTEIETYADEMFVRFVTGKEPLENFNQYIVQLKKMGIERAIELQQAALDRYNAR